MIKIKAILQSIEFGKKGQLFQNSLHFELWTFGGDPPPHTLLDFFQTPLQHADPTQLQLVGVGVEFVFPCHK